MRKPSLLSQPLSSIAILTLVGMSAIVAPVWLAASTLADQVRNEESHRLAKTLQRTAERLASGADRALADEAVAAHADSLQMHPNEILPTIVVEADGVSRLLSIEMLSDGDYVVADRSFAPDLISEIEAEAGVHGLRLQSSPPTIVLPTIGDERIGLTWTTSPMVWQAVLKALPLLLLGAVGTLALNVLLLRDLRRSSLEIDRQRAEATRIAFEDSLTGVGSRHAFAKAFERASAEDGTSVLYLDLDDFKQVNDAHGHAAGDELIKQTASRISDSVRPQDSVFRVGGDEFVVLMPDAEKGMAATVAMRIRARMTQPFRIASTNVFATTSIGVAEASTGTTLEDLWHLADAAMYDAKGRRSPRSVA